VGDKNSGGKGQFVIKPPRQGGICKGGRGGFSPSLLHDIPGTGWSLAIPGRDTIYPMHNIYASNYPPHCICT